MSEGFGRKIGSPLSERYYSVSWPDDWIANDLTENKNARDRFSKILSFVGGRPKGQTTFFQHAIIVSNSSRENIIQEIKNREEKANETFVKQESGQLSGQPSTTLLFQNKADQSNKTSYHLVESKGLVFVLHIHGPSDHATYLNEAAELILTTFRIKK